MSEFKCPVVRVESVIDHPNADRLSIIKLVNLGYTCISAKLDDLSHRYKVGDLVAYIPSSSVLPPDLLQIMGFWDNESGKGTLAGSNGNRVKPMKLRVTFSEGLVVRSLDGSRHPEHGRRIAKFISPDYLLRKSNNATEFN